MLKKRLTALLLGSAMAMATVAISEFEGRRNYAYLDIVGVPTICDGYTHGVKLGDYKTDAQCDQLLQSELKTTMAAVEKAVKVPITEPMKAALVSFAYNVGIPAFRSSTLLRTLNAGNYASACDQMRRWIYAGGIKRKGLANRREIERWLCLQ